LYRKRPTAKGVVYAWGSGDALQPLTQSDSLCDYWVVATVKMQVIGALMRKLVHLAFGILKSQKPFDPNYLNATP
jgi:hypothetical protein